MSSKDYQPTQATDENGEDRGTFESPFLVQARSETEANLGTTNGDWTFTARKDES
ncbi:hypothetical protein GCM10009837_07190 [Streptomyces durmitorensis]|uniref:Uncharacterized protein n=1 Tax=Streptomyces durmitorensis TaxID=319947 RepID=A0ABY4PN67_9ACTN|nr:hypothetical protein [Streptomyces durmitorensis]UQT54388.1 hypothetical protein M4V62_04395 [Streptomyces durmitorensis]